MRRPLSRVRLFVCVPLGVLWLGVMAVLAVPVIVLMTVLYYLRVAGSALAQGRRNAGVAARDDA